MNTPFFSILIANYNNGRYIMDAIHSIQAQTFINWEIVIVDDGSIDDSVLLYQSLHTDERIRIYYNNTNKGCGYTKSRCISEANGLWCIFLDPDDLLRVDALEIVAKHIREYPQYGVFFSHMYVCDEELNVLYDDTFQPQSKEWETFLHYQRGIPLYCFNKGVYLSTRGIHLSLPQSVDIDLYYLLSEKTKAYYINLPLYYYRNNPKSLTKNSARATATHLWVMLDSLQRQSASEQTIWHEIEGFWLWRTEPLYDEINRLQQDKFYRIGQKIRKIKQTLAHFLKCK